MLKKEKVNNPEKREVVSNDNNMMEGNGDILGDNKIEKEQKFWAFQK